MQLYYERQGTFDWESALQEGINLPSSGFQTSNDAGRTFQNTPPLTQNSLVSLSLFLASPISASSTFQFPLPIQSNYSLLSFSQSQTPPSIHGRRSQSQRQRRLLLWRLRRRHQALLRRHRAVTDEPRALFKPIRCIRFSSEIHGGLSRRRKDRRTQTRLVQGLQPPRRRSSWAGQIRRRHLSLQKGTRN
ncbi:hypothetical protein RJT34_05456 [Clitoria ternatea]|uniref:Uncharacterized protein n=1 Tax=Clitoria ternatea TaxID=43366 RepID=A0AAN9PT45_CLITE